MKKVLSFLLVAVLAVSAFAGCTQAPAANSTSTESQATSQADSKADSTTDSQAPTSQPEASQPAETSTTPAEESSQEAAPVEGAGQYVYKDSVSTLASNWNPHTYQTSDDAYPADFIRVGLYGFMEFLKREVAWYDDSSPHGRVIDAPQLDFQVYSHCRI